MTRSECEDKVIDLVKQIRKTVMEFGLEECGIMVGSNIVGVYELEKDEDGRPVMGRYLLNKMENVRGM